MNDDDTPDQDRDETVKDGPGSEPDAPDHLDTEPDTGAETEDTAVDTSGTDDSGTAGWHHSFSSEDWFVIVLGVLLIGIFVLAYFPLGQLLPGGNHSTAAPEIVRYCEKTASAVEANASLPAGSTCKCVPPGTFDASRFSVNPKIDNATELFLVSCKIPNQKNLIFPVRRVKNTSINTTKEFPNTTVVQ